MAGHRSHSSIDMIYSVYNSYANHPSLNFPEDDDDNEKHGDAASVHTVASISSATGLTSPMTAEFGHARRRSRSREMSGKLGGVTKSQWGATMNVKSRVEEHEPVSSGWTRTFVGTQKRRIATFSIAVFLLLAVGAVVGAHTGMANANKAKELAAQNNGSSSNGTDTTGNTTTSTKSSSASTKAATKATSKTSSTKSSSTKLTTTTKAKATSTSSSTSAVAAVASTATKVTGCFPLTATLPSSGVPTTGLSNWWCDQSSLYGFLGFSYPLEATSCSDSTNSYESISADFAAMKKNFGASMVRIYGQSCRTLSLYESIVQAAADNNMGVILMVWFGFDGTDVWETAQTSLYSLFTTSSLSTLALYVVHSVDFGSEPIGDQVDGGSVQFTAGLKAFRDRMNGYGVKVGISEDWDREGIMSGSDGTGLGSVGQGIADNSDYVHAHIMPYYHGSEAPDISDAWPYITKQMAWFADTLPGLPLIITESPWAWEQGTGHDRDSNEDAVSLSSFTTYWNTFAKNCATFKKAKVGWFIHTYTDYFEPGFGLLDASGDQPRILGYYPAKC